MVIHLWLQMYVSESGKSHSYKSKDMRHVVYKTESLKLKTTKKGLELAYMVPMSFSELILPRLCKQALNG